MRRVSGGVLLGVCVLAGCAGAPRSGTDVGDRPAARAPAQAARPERDGAEPNPPPNLVAVPDAQPALEPFRIGGPNKPYVVDGTTYTPLVRDQPFVQRGLASWYGRKFHGLSTTSGERYDMYAMSAAHPTLPIPSYARVRNPANGRSVVVRINDRGPFHSSRIIDLSYTAALKLDLLRGVATVEVQRITGDEIREASQRPKAGVEVASATLLDADASPLGRAGLAGSLDRLPAADRPVPAATATPGATPMAPAPSSDAIKALAAEAPAGPPPEARVADASPPARPAFWVQLGAFRASEGAALLRDRVVAGQPWIASLLAVFHEAPFHRLQAGPYPDREAAREVAERLRPTGVDAVIVARPP